MESADGPGDMGKGEGEHRSHTAPLDKSGRSRRREADEGGELARVARGPESIAR